MPGYPYAYGAVEPVTGESFFLVMPYCNTECVNISLRALPSSFSKDIIPLCFDGASWHKPKAVKLLEDIVLFHSTLSNGVNLAEAALAKERSKRRDRGKATTFFMRILLSAVGCGGREGGIFCLDTELRKKRASWARRYRPSHIGSSSR